MEKVAIVESCATPTAVFEDAVRSDLHRTCIRLGETCANCARFRRASDGLDTERDDFDGASRVGVAVRLGVQLVKLGDGVARPVDAEFVALAVVTQIGGAVKDGTCLFRSEGGAGFGFERAEDSGDLRGAGRQHHGTREFAAQVSIKNAESRERAGGGGYENPANAERLAKSTGVERAGSAEREKREGTRVVTAFYGDTAKGRLHAGVSDAKDTFGEVLDGIEMPGAKSGEHLRCAGCIEPHGSSEEVLGMEAAESEIGVGDCHSIATAIAGGAGIGSGGLRADLKGTGGVDPRE